MRRTARGVWRRLTTPFRAAGRAIANSGRALADNLDNALDVW